LGKKTSGVDFLQNCVKVKGHIKKIFPILNEGGVAMGIDYEKKIEAIIKENNQLNRWRKKTGWVTEKQGLVAKRDDLAPDWLKGNTVIRGKLYSVLPNTILPLRTLFFKEPVKIGSEKFYLEVKGYGCNGRELYFQEHVSGDIYYGMYLDAALREFERLNFALSLGCFVPIPIAVVEIPRAEYLKKGIDGFEGRLDAELHFSLRNPEKLEKIEKLVGKINEFDPEGISKKLVKLIKRNYKDNLEEGIRFLINELKNPQKSGFGINDAADALFCGRKVGYLVRASRCPIRVGDPSDKDIDTPEFRKVARSAGRTFMILLKNKIIHHCPGTGNWTIAGELTDFTDTFSFDEEAEIKRHICNLKEHGHIEKAALKDFVKYLIGPPHAGLLCPYFLEGMFGEPIGLDDAVQKTLKLF
jgi:hypothetical protein